jgi:hypothetical protein
MSAAHNTTESARPSQRLALRASAVVELATGLALLAVPTVVFDVLIGSASDPGTTLVARILGGALVALGVAGWMAGPTPERGLTLAFIGYNVITTLLLVVGGLNGSADGSLLWPAAALHAIASAALGITADRRIAKDTPGNPPAA